MIMSDKNKTNQGGSPDDIQDHRLAMRPATDLSVFSQLVPSLVLAQIRIISDHYGDGYLQIPGSSTIYSLDGDAASLHVLRLCAEVGNIPRSRELDAIMDTLKAMAKLSAERLPVWLRVAATPTGAVIDVGDDHDTRIEVTPGQYKVLKSPSSPLFVRTSTMRALPIPDATGDLGLLDQYLNVPANEKLLVKALLSYLLVHAKVDTTSFPGLFIGGESGSGKTSFSRMLKALVDPDTIAVQAFPRNEIDLSIATASSHLAIFDNARHIALGLGDMCCIALTGGAIPTRKFYSNSGRFVHRLHGAIGVNSIHSVVQQPDLAQRGVFVNLKPLESDQRRSEREMAEQFHTDLPKIFAGLLQLAADALVFYPTVTPTNPERMIDFSRWLAAIEMVHKVPAGIYQSTYSDNLRQGMRDALIEHPLAAAVIALMENREDRQWSGKPGDLLETLSFSVSRRTTYSNEWPDTPSALSKRLQVLKTALQRQGIEIERGRGRERRITITRIEGDRDE